MWGTPKRVSEEEGVPDMLEEEEPPVGIEEEQETPPTSPSSHPSQRRVEEQCDATGASHILHLQVHPPYNVHDHHTLFVHHTSKVSTRRHHTSSSWSSWITYFCFDQPIKLAMQFDNVGLQKFIHHHVFDVEE
jgi:hypothetical protein